MQYRFALLYRTRHSLLEHFCRVMWHVGVKPIPQFKHASSFAMMPSPLVCFFHFTKLGKVHDYLTLTSAWSKEAQKEKEKCESGQDLTEEICAVAEAVIPT